MTQGHYKGIAKIIQQNLTTEASSNMRVTQLAEDLADYFAFYDSKFQPKKFLADCGTHQAGDLEN